MGQVTLRSHRTSPVSRGQNIAKNHETLLGISPDEKLAKDSSGIQWKTHTSGGPSLRAGGHRGKFCWTPIPTVEHCFYKVCSSHRTPGSSLRTLLLLYNVRSSCTTLLPLMCTPRHFHATLRADVACPFAQMKYRGKLDTLVYDVFPRNVYIKWEDIDIWNNPTLRGTWYIL